MPDFCPQCGKSTKKSDKLCYFCNYPLYQDYDKNKDFKTELEKKIEHPTQDFISEFNATVQMNRGDLKTEQLVKEVIVKTEEKEKSKYTLSPSQRNLFLQKVLPILLLGNIAWLIGEITFSTSFFIGWDFLPFYIIITIIDIILFISLGKIILTKTPSAALIVYIIFAFTAGIISNPIVMLRPSLAKQIQMFVFSALECTIIVGLMGITLKEKYFSEGYVALHLALFLAFVILAEIIFIIVFKIHNYLLTIPITVSGICVVTLVTMFFGAIATKKLEYYNSPMYIAYKIISIFILVLCTAIFVAIIVLIIVVIAILLEDADIGFPSWLHFPTWFWGPGSISSSPDYKKKKKEQILKN